MENNFFSPFISSAACLNWTLPRLRRTSAAMFITRIWAQFEFSLEGTDTDLDTFYDDPGRSFTDTSSPRWYGVNPNRRELHEPHWSSGSASEWTFLLTRLDTISTYARSALKHRFRPASCYFHVRATKRYRTRISRAITSRTQTTDSSRVISVLRNIK